MGCNLVGRARFPTLALAARFVGMAELVGGAGLLLKAEHLLFIADEMRRKHLDGDNTLAHLRIVAIIDAAHASDAEHLRQSVAPSERMAN